MSKPKSSSSLGRLSLAIVCIQNPHEGSGEVCPKCDDELVAALQEVVREEHSEEEIQRAIRWGRRSGEQMFR